jgi:hypothetical protein
MKAALSITILLMIFLLEADCYAQSTSGFQNVGGDFGRTWMSRYEAQNPQPSEQNLTNDLWSWGGSPKGTIVVNGQLMADPYYVWKSLNYTSGWLGKVYTDPNTGYPVYGYIDPYTGMHVNYYIDPKTGKPVYTNENPYGFLDYGNGSFYYPPDYLTPVYGLPSIFI